MLARALERRQQAGRSRSPKRDAGGGGGGANGNPIAKFESSLGSFEAEIFLDRVPITASNFIDLCKTGFYEGIHFHRVIPNFMNQFGCPNAKDPQSATAGTGGPPDGAFKNLRTGGMERRSNGGNIRDENISRDSNKVGTLSMANTGVPNSGGSQFFINVKDNTFLDWFSPGASKHPVFGQIISGLDVCKAISKVPTKDDCPVNPIKMIRITVTDGGARTAKGHNQVIPGYKTTYKLVQPGKGGFRVVKGKTVTVHATGVVKETGKKFWSTKDPGQSPFEYKAGVGGVITGWDQGCLGMMVGEIRELLIPADEAYGSKGFPAWGIGPGSTLNFTLECLSIK
eukprot:TRINITY_DN7187_c1_g2_i1.p1 TRINITY_DN7187_c1_g2~~TRINITY_DN7187_c1_g2_i1.p1  ORF type:complete len:341 (+),score=86.59 TRINITY_DN7187_c1_g2_i1:101-1123(+)